MPNEPKRHTPSRWLSLFTCTALALAACAPVSGDELAGSEQRLGARPELALMPAVLPGHRAIAVSLSNPSDRAVSCTEVKFRAPIARLDHCGGQPISYEYLGLGAISLAPGQTQVWASTADATAGGPLGEAHLQKVEATRKALGFTDEILEFCEMGATDRVLDCGFTCTHGGTARSYDAEWRDDNAQGGWKKLKCLADGTVETIELRCAGGLTLGSSRDGAVGTGYTVVQICGADGLYTETARCHAGYQPQPDQKSCIEASCGGVPAGGTMTLQLVDHGKLTAVCRYGQPDMNTQKLECDAEYVAEGFTACVPRPMRNCPNAPHGQCREYAWCAGNDNVYTNHCCHDGAETVTRRRVPRFGECTF
jgi:hypothetical protein